MSRPQTPVNSTASLKNPRTSHKRLRVTANSSESANSSLFTPVLSRSTPNIPLVPFDEDTEKLSFSDRMVSSSHLNSFNSRPRSRPTSATSQQGKQQHEGDKSSRVTLREGRRWSRSALACGGALVSIGLGALALIVMQAHRASVSARDSDSQKSSASATGLKRSGVFR